MTSADGANGRRVPRARRGRVGQDLESCPASSADGGHPGNELEIVRYGHPALRQKAQRVGQVTADVRSLADSMVELMRAAGGLGLAANQVGVARRLAVIEIERGAAGGREQAGPTVLIEPELISATGAEAADEGCLSLPRLYGVVERPSKVVIRARDLSGKRFKLEAEGLLARALCHEMDHLDGKLFIDRVDAATLYWLVGQSEEGEAITQPTTLEEALKVFGAAGGRGRVRPVR